MTDTKTPAPTVEEMGSAKQSAGCDFRFKTQCPNMKEREGCTSMSYEHYDCKVCGAHVALDYDEMR
jgi:hypothetical protein